MYALSDKIAPSHFTCFFIGKDSYTHSTSLIMGKSFTCSGTLIFPSNGAICYTCQQALQLTDFLYRVIPLSMHSDFMQKLMVHGMFVNKYNKEVLTRSSSFLNR